jgi:hypothetical protein
VSFFLTITAVDPVNTLKDDGFYKLSLVENNFNDPGWETGEGRAAKMTDYFALSQDDKKSSSVPQCSGADARASSYACAVPAPTCCDGCYGSECNGCLPHGGTLLTFSCCPMNARTLQKDQFWMIGSVILSGCVALMCTAFQFWYMRSDPVNYWQNTRFET